MNKSKKLTIALSILSTIALGLGFVANALSHWFPPGAGVVP